MAEGFFRSKKGFTVVQNGITKDVTISLKAKGLYLVIQSYITMPNKKWTKEDFLRLTKEGRKAFDSAWNELKNSGYLKVHFMPDNGKWRTEYELLDEADLGAHTLYHNKAGDITSDNVSRAQKKAFLNASNDNHTTSVQIEKNTVEAGKDRKYAFDSETDSRYPLFGSNAKMEDDRYPPFGSKGSSGSYSENYDVVGRELMLEYEIRLLPDDECILFVRGEKPIRDKKWFPWEHEEYENAKTAGVFSHSAIQDKAEEESSSCQFMNNKSYEYVKKQIDKNDNIKIHNVDAYEFMMMDLDKVMGKIHGVEIYDTTTEVKSNNAEIRIKPEMICSVMEMDATRRENQKREYILQNYDKLSLLDIYSSGVLSDSRRSVMRELIQKGAEEREIKSIVSLELSEQEVQEKKGGWMSLHDKYK